MNEPRMDPRGYVVPAHIPPRKPGTEWPRLNLNMHQFEPLLPVNLVWLPLIPVLLYWDPRTDRILHHLHDEAMVCHLWFRNDGEEAPYIGRAVIQSLTLLARQGEAALQIVGLSNIPDPRSDGSAAFRYPPPLPAAERLPNRIEAIGVEMNLAGIPVGPIRMDHIERALDVMRTHDEMHRPYPGGYDRETKSNIYYCYVCGKEWPCPTEQEIRASGGHS